MDRAIRDKVYDEREKLAALWPEGALENPHLHHGIGMIAHGVPPGDAWRAVAVSLAQQNKKLLEVALERLRHTVGPITVPLDALTACTSPTVPAEDLVIGGTKT